MTKNSKENWNRTTDLCVDVKTFLRSDCTSQIGKGYQGVLTRDSDDHYTFVETIPSTSGKRNPHVYIGKYITITRRDDGTLRPNFKPMKVGPGFSIERYAMCVSSELLWALDGLVEESEFDGKHQ